MVRQGSACALACAVYVDSDLCPCFAQDRVGESDRVREGEEERELVDTLLVAVRLSSSRGHLLLV